MTPIRFSTLLDVARLRAEEIMFQNSDTLIFPELISFNDRGVMIAGNLFLCEDPKLSFCKVLSCFKEPTMHEAVKYVGGNISIGNGCTIGGAGFGYVRNSAGTPEYMPHLGRVILHDEVQIHNGVNIDRGVIKDTVIGRGTKIDSLVHIAHNVQISENCMIVAGAVIGGSAVICKNVFIGMGARIKEKVKIGEGAVIGTGAVVLCDVPAGETWVGVPAKKLVK